MALFKVRLHRQCGPAILLSDSISFENFLSPRHRFEMDIPFEIYAPRNSNHTAQRNGQPHIACVNTPLQVTFLKSNKIHIKNEKGQVYAIQKMILLKAALKR